MPNWVVIVLEEALQLLLKNIDTNNTAKKGLATLLRLIDSAVQAADARVTGPFKGVTDEIAATLHTAVEAICAALGQ